MVEELQSKIWQLERQVFQLQTLFEVAQTLNRCRQPEELYSQILAIMAGTFGARESLALRFDEGKPIVAAYRGGQEQIAKNMHATLPSTFLQGSTRQQKHMIGEALGESGGDQDFTLWEWIEVRNQPVGGLFFGKKILGEPYTSNDEALLRAVCSYAAHVLENITLYQQLERAHQRLAAENLALKQQVRQEALHQQIIGRSRPVEQLRQMIVNYARSEAPVLITGETGTGKELVARAIHEASSRASGPFIAINCAAIPENLVESEFFGIEEGVATGVKRRMGYFEQAHTGTLFIDEIGDMPVSTQVKLLRVLQDGVVRRIGARTEIPVNVRIVAATHQNLQQLIHENRFREDLFYRISVLEIEVPPLRERREDIAVLAQYFLQQKNQARGEAIAGIAPETLRLLEQYDWPGNIRELENEVERWNAILRKGDRVLPEHLSPRIVKKMEYGAAASDAPQSLRDAVDRLERQMILKTLQEAGGNKSEVARRLGLSRLGLQRKMERLKIRYSEGGHAAAD